MRLIVRSREGMPDSILAHGKVSVILGAVLDLDDEELDRHVSGCNAVASCLGHNLSFRGIFGSPRTLVSDATRRLCLAIKASKPKEPVRFVLMNSAGCRNPDLDEQVSFFQRCILGLLRLSLPPHADNENAARYLRTAIGQGDRAIEWVVVRPDSLLDAEQVTQTEVHCSPIRNAIFDPGQTSRINVACYMADLICSDDTWHSWKGMTPVIYNRQIG